MVPDVNHAQQIPRIRERTIIRLILYRNRYWVYRIESYWLLLYQGKPDITCITSRLAAVNGSRYTGRRRAPSPTARERCLMVHDTGGVKGAGGGRRL